MPFRRVFGPKNLENGRGIQNSFENQFRGQGIACHFHFGLLSEKNFPANDKPLNSDQNIHVFTMDTGLMQASHSWHPIATLYPTGPFRATSLFFLQDGKPRSANFPWNHHEVARPGRDPGTGNPCLSRAQDFRCLGGFGDARRLRCWAGRPPLNGWSRRGSPGPGGGQGPRQTAPSWHALSWPLRPAPGRRMPHSADLTPPLPPFRQPLAPPPAGSAQRSSSGTGGLASGSSVSNCPLWTPHGFKYPTVGADSFMVGVLVSRRTFDPSAAIE